MPTKRIPLRIVFYRDEGVWVAHCLEFDLMGDGDTQDLALRRLCEAIAMQVEATLESGDWSNLFNPAPGRFLEMFAEGKDVAHGELNIHTQSPLVEFDDVSTREYSDHLACV